MAAFNDSVTRSSAMLKGWIQTIAGQAAPVLSWLVDVVGNIFPRAGKAFMGTLNAFRGAMLLAWSATAEFAAAIASLGAKAAKTLGFDGAADGMKAFADRARDAAEILRDQSAFEFDSAGERIVTAIMPAIDGFNDLAGAAATVPVSLESIAGTTDTLTQKTQKATAAQKEFNDMVKEAQGFIDKTRTPLEEYQGQMTRLAELFESGAFDNIGGLDAYQQTVQRMADEFKAGMESATVDGAGKIDELKKIGEDGAKSMQSAMESFFMNPTREGFDGLLQSFLQILAQMAAQAAAAQITQSLFGGSSGGGGGFDFGGMVASMFGGGKVAAVGGPVVGGQPLVVGERGPELLVPSGAGNIIPNDRLGGRGGQNITMNISTPDANSFRRSDAQIATEMGRRMRGAQRNM
jgi:hypothetical protein